MLMRPSFPTASVPLEPTQGQIFDCNINTSDAILDPQCVHQMRTSLRPKEVDVATRIPLFHKPALIVVLPECLQIRRLYIAFVVRLHHGLDSIRGFLGMVEWNPTNVMMQDVILDSSMKQIPTNEAKVSVNRRGAPAKKGPSLVWVVWQRHVGVLQEGYCHCCIYRSAC